MLGHAHMYRNASALRAMLCRRYVACQVRTLSVCLPCQAHMYRMDIAPELRADLVKVLELSPMLIQAMIDTLGTLVASARACMSSDSRRARAESTVVR